MLTSSGRALGSSQDPGWETVPLQAFTSHPPGDTLEGCTAQDRSDPYRALTAYVAHLPVHRKEVS